MDSGIDIRGSGLGLGSSGLGIGGSRMTHHQQTSQLEYNTHRRNTNYSPSESDMRKKYKALKKSVTLFSFVGMTMFALNMKGMNELKNELSLVK